MNLTVLGKSPAWQDVDGACSGYLVSEGDTNLLVDCGNGVFSKLRMHLDYVDVDAIVISHLHADHFLDLIPYAFALVFAPRQQPVAVDRWPGTEFPARPTLYGPPGSAEVFRGIAGSWGMPDLLERAFKVVEYDPDRNIEVGPVNLSFQFVPHFIETYAIEIRCSSGKRITYGADCRPNRELVEFAADTDLLIAEATLPRPERTGLRGHLTPEEAGEHARDAGAKKLMLTHISDELDPDWAVTQAKTAYDGPVEMAAEGKSVHV